MHWTTRILKVMALTMLFTLSAVGADPDLPVLPAASPEVATYLNHLGSIAPNARFDDAKNFLASRGADLSQTDVAHVVRSFEGPKRLSLVGQYLIQKRSRLTAVRLYRFLELVEKPQSWDEQVQIYLVRWRAIPDGPDNRSWWDSPLTRIRGLSKLYHRASSEKLKEHLAGIAAERGLKSFPLAIPSPDCEGSLELIGVGTTP